ncbi:MAG TPA: HAD hydrolase family protein, partial [Anaerolineae bacterium]|nr:HAD hydrolase family protein [Anaerolineae bacterium]
VLAVGDHENDIPMVQWAGIGVAMGNATPALQAVADWIAPSLAEDGAAAALERFVLEMAA